jgi:hypothetical protein
MSRQPVSASMHDEIFSRASDGPKKFSLSFYPSIFAAATGQLQAEAVAFNQLQLKQGIIPTWAKMIPLALLRPPPE